MHSRIFMLGKGLPVLGMVITLMASLLSSCKGTASKPEPVLQYMSLTWGPNLAFEQGFFQSFGERNRIRSQFVPNIRLASYRELLKRHSAEPDLLQLDIVWPSILGDDLVDLKPYVQDLDAFAPQLLENYTVHGRLIALPAYVDLGALYYRPELLEKYGFRHPPETWDELELMAKRIQDGERRAGNKDFWGYTWQGSAGEGGTCNFLEWQASAGAGNFIEPNGLIHVQNSKFIAAMKRATGWIGSISPPAEYAYHEDDSANLWGAGQTAFMRNWASGYGLFAAQPGKDTRHFAVTRMPAGAGGYHFLGGGTLGGLGIGVSKYAANRELAVKALLEITNEENDLRRLLATGSLPTHVAVMERADVKGRNLLFAVSKELVGSTVSRPALIAGDKYDEASLEYAKAVNSVLRRQDTAEGAMEKLEKRLVALTGLGVRRD